MGKWASQKKASSANHHGQFSAPPASGFALTTDSATSELCTKSVALPDGVSGWQFMVVRISDGAIVSIGFTTGATKTATGLTTGNLCRGYVAWASSVTARLSDFVLVGAFSVGS